MVIGSVSRPPPGKSRVDLVVGALIGVGGIFVMGVSVIIIKGELDELPMLWSTWVRLAAGTLGIVPIILWRRGRSALIGVLRPASSWRWAVPGAFFGTYLAMACWIGGMKYTDVSRAALLNQLSAIFIFALATVFLREPITLRRVVAVCLALVGAVIVVV